jgi:DNA-binding GntR family transcriptional regulator
MTRASSLAHNTIRELIISGSVQPGERLLEEELAHRVGVSRTSIRDAIRRLEAEGFVRTEANRGTFVSQLSSSEVDEIFQLRAVLEGHATALAALHGQPEHWEALSQVATEIDHQLTQPEVPDSDRYTSFQTCNTHFHNILLQASGSKRLQSLARSLIELPLVTMKQHTWPGEVRIRQSNKQHWEIIESLRARDPLLGRLKMQTHIISARPLAMLNQSLMPIHML